MKKTILCICFAFVFLLLVSCAAEKEWIQQLLNGELSTVEHTVTFDPNNGEEPFTQTVKYGKKAKRPEDPARAGYAFTGWMVSDGVETEKWRFAGYVVTEDVTLTASWDYETFELPIVNIDTENTAITSQEEYVDMTFCLENCDEELSKVSGGIRLRGNTTLGLAKKPYRIKFDKKQSLFGLEKAKSWVLLAEYLDPSGLHNYTAFSLASAMPGLGFTPTPYKVNVYLNGSYVGMYTLCEQVQENEGRMDIELDEIDASMVDLKDFNFFICMDFSVTADSTAVLGETYYFIEEYDRYFELKYPEKSQFASEEQFQSFFAQLETYTKELMGAFYQKDIAKIKSEVNINSLIDYLIIDQIMGERDHEAKSFNMYYTNTSSNPEENGRLSFGPIWDYDWSLHVPWTGEPNQYYEVSDEIYSSNLFFTAMIETPEFFEMVKDRYHTYAKAALETYLDGFDELVLSIQKSVQMNNDVWYSGIDGELSKKNLDFLKAFLETRKKVLDTVWALE